MKTKTRGMLIAGAAAALFLSGAVQARAEEKAGEMVNCAGINACKGKGNIKATAADCKAKGGKVVEGGHK